MQELLVKMKKESSEEVYQKLVQGLRKKNYNPINAHF